MTPDWAARPTSVPYAVFGDPQSLNLYGYVRNDPVSLADADGHGVVDYIVGWNSGDIAIADVPSYEPQHSTGQDPHIIWTNNSLAQNTAADKPAPQPAPTDPKGNPTPPPVKVPGAPDLPWKWNPNPQNPRGGTWGPDGWKGVPRQNSIPPRNQQVGIASTSCNLLCR